jgi:hypothetical protein
MCSLRELVMCSLRLRPSGVALLQSLRGSAPADALESLSPGGSAAAPPEEPPTRTRRIQGLHALYPGRARPAPLSIRRIFSERFPRGHENLTPREQVRAISRIPAARDVRRVANGPSDPLAPRSVNSPLRLRRGARGVRFLAARMASQGDLTNAQPLLTGPLRPLSRRATLRAGRRDWLVARWLTRSCQSGLALEPRSEARRWVALVQRGGCEPWGLVALVQRRDCEPQGFAGLVQRRDYEPRRFAALVQRRGSEPWLLAVSFNEEAVSLNGLAALVRRRDCEPHGFAALAHSMEATVRYLGYD